MHAPYPPELLALFVFFLAGLEGASAQTTLQGPNDCTTAGAYTLCQNLWGADTGTGSETTTLNSASGNSISWETNYTWSNSPDNVKAYPNVYHNTAKGMQLQDIVSAPTSWQWYYQSASDDLRADVSYDIWTGVPQSGDPASSASSYEIMIWLSARGGVSGIGNVVAQNIQLGGNTWNLRYGPNSNWEVYSFITAQGDITNFNADLNDFFQYLTSQQGVANSQYLQAIQTGTEPFTGSAELVISNFNVSVSTANSATTSASSSSAASTSTQATTVSGSSISGGNKTISSSGSSVRASSTSGAPASQTSDTTPGVRPVGQSQCRLQAPKSGSQVRRRERRWFGQLFG